MLSFTCRRDGRLALAATRGDGTQGEDVTHNAATGTIQGLPLSLAGSSSSSSNGNGNGGMLQLPSEVEVRGEVFMTTTDFEQVSCGFEVGLELSKWIWGRGLLSLHVQHLHVYPCAC